MKNNLKLNILSRNLLVSLEEINKNEKIVKLLGNNNDEPLKNDIKDIIFKNIFIEPFNMEIPQEQKTELRIFFPEGIFESANVLSTSTIYFQIIIHNSLSRIKINGEKTLREFEIMNELITIFSKNSINGLGNILFQGYQYAHIDKDYHMYTLMGEILNGQ